MIEQMTDVERKYEAFKEAVLITFDDGYSNGMTTEQMLSDMKAFIADTELGEMDSTVTDIWNEWMEDRGVD
jgi:hypothetical protein